MSMTTRDWLDLLQANREELQKQGWAIEDKGLGLAPIRNAIQQCPLCALATLFRKPNKPIWRGSWAIALVESFDVDGKDFYSAEAIANAADLTSYTPELRAELLSILNIQEPT